LDICSPTRDCCFDPDAEKAGRRAGDELVARLLLCCVAKGAVLALPEGEENLGAAAMPMD
jgi:hypothetical protein